MKETVALPATKLWLIEAGKEEINKNSEMPNFKFQHISRECDTGEPIS